MFIKDHYDNRPLPHDRQGFKSDIPREQLNLDINSKDIFSRDMEKEYANSFRLDENGNLIDQFGRVIHYRSQLTTENDFPNIVTESGRKINKRNCIGLFEKDSQGRILFAG